MNAKSDAKSGKRIKKSMAQLLEEAIEKLSAMLIWSRYEEDGKAILPPATRGDLNRSRAIMTPRRTGGGGTPNWSAKVGEIIIGNLMRGEGGRFASAKNIAAMMGYLDSAGITPNMFVGMQNLLAGNAAGIDAQTMGYLRSAGLINEAGVVQAKANEIINAIKTGDPKNLQKVLKPPTSGGGGGRGGGSAKKPTREETAAANVEKLKPDIIAQTNVTEAMIDAILEFYDGGSLDPEMQALLVDAGLIKENADGSPYLTGHARSFVAAIRRGDLRGALDGINRAAGTAHGGISTPQRKVNLEKVSKTLIESGGMTQAQIDALVAFDENKEVGETELADLIETGLVDIDTRGSFYITTKGQQLIRLMERGLERDSLDVLGRARSTFAERQRTSASVRARSAQSLISSGDLSREEADGLIRAWVGGTLSDAAISALEMRGFMREGQLTPYAKILLRGMELGNEQIMRRALGALSGKALGGLKGLGNDWFITWTTNAFEDREGETFTTASIEEYLSEVDEKGCEHKTDFWHIKGSEFATTRWQGGVGRFLVEIHQYDDTPVGHAFKKLFEMYPDGHKELAPYGWGCSHEYIYVPEDRRDGVYDWFRIRKSTVLPLQEAANPFTLAEFGIGGKNMKLSHKQESALAQIGKEVGIENLVEMIVEVGTERTNALEKSGARYKSKGDVMEITNIASKMTEMAVAEGVPQDAKEGLETMATNLEEGGDVVTIQRMLMELLTELPEEIRPQAEELVMVLGSLVEPEPVEPEEVEEIVPEPEVMEDEPVEEELVDEEPVDVEPVEQEPVGEEEEEETEEKGLSDKIVEQLVDALRLDRLSEVLVGHDNGLKSLADGMNEIVSKMGGVLERIDALEKGMASAKQIEEEVGEIKRDVQDVKKQTESVVSEKRFTPMWGNGVHFGSVARAEELGVEEVKEYRKPEVPSAIAGIRNAMLKR